MQDFKRFIFLLINLSNLHLTKANSQASLNNLLGQSLHQQTIVHFERNIPIPPENLTRYMTQTVTQAPTIRQMQLNTDRQRVALNAHREQCTIFDWRDCDTHIELREAHDRARLNQDISTRTMETALRVAHSNMYQLLTQQESAQLELYQATQSLEAAKANLELGRGTQFEVTIAQHEIYNVELAIERILYRLWLLGFTLENPVLL